MGIFGTIQSVLLSSIPDGVFISLLLKIAGKPSESNVTSLAYVWLAG